MVTIYTGPNCHRCTITKRHLSKRGLTFDEVRIDEDEDEADLLRELGFSGLPVVHYGDTVFEGYHPDKLDTFVA